MLAEGAGVALFIGGCVTLDSGAASLTDVMMLGGGIGGMVCTDWVVAGTEGARLALLGLETGLTDKSLAGVLVVDPFGTLLACPRVMRVYSASSPSLSYDICIGRLPREYLAVTFVRIVSA